MSIHMKLTYKKNKSSKVPSTYNALIYRRHFSPLFERAVDAFLEQLLINIHIDTGMSISSVAAFASMSHNKNMVSQFIRGYNSKHKYSSTMFPGMMENKGTTHGQALGEAAALKKEYKLDYGTPQLPVFELVFNIQVLQYWLHEQSGRAPNSGDWRSVEKAYDAFKAVWDTGLDTQKIATEFVEWLTNG